MAIAFSSAGKIPVPEVLGRDCIQIGNKDGRDFTEHRCPLKWYVADKSI